MKQFRSTQILKKTMRRLSQVGRVMRAVLVPSGRCPKRCGRWVLECSAPSLQFGVLQLRAWDMGMEQANLIINVGSVVQCVVFGAYGTKWQQTHLAARGFVFKDTVTAANAKGAIELYMKNTSHDQSGRQPRSGLQEA